MASAELENEPLQRLAEISNAIFSLNYREHTAPADWQALYGRYVGEMSAVQPYERWASGHAKLRIGYPSADFRLHPVLYFVWAMFTRFSRECFVFF